MLSQLYFANHDHIERIIHVIESDSFLCKFKNVDF